MEKEKLQMMVPKDFKDKLKKAAEAKIMNVTTYVIQALLRQIKEDERDDI